MSDLPAKGIRIRTPATAVVLHNHRVWGPCVVESLAASGVTLRGHPDTHLAPGEVTVVLTVAESQLIRLKGALRRIEASAGECQRCQVYFQHCSPDLEDKLHKAVVEQLERARMPMVVALDCGRLSRTHLRRDLHRLGREILFFDNVLEALWFTGDSPDAFSTILVDSSFVRANGPEVLQFLRDRWPEKRRLFTCNRSDVGMAELRALRWSVHGVLEAPWTSTTLETSLGILAAGQSDPARRVLFVDDEPAVLEALQNRMRKHLIGCEAIWATSGEVALAEFRARPFDVVVSDLRMPGMDGVTLLRRVRDSAPKARRIVLSGYELEDAFAVADCVLRKPCPTEVLSDAVLSAP